MYPGYATTENRRAFEHVVFNNEFLLITGGDIETTNDFKKFKKVTKYATFDGHYTKDAVVVGDTLYTLSIKKYGDNSYSAEIYSTKDLSEFSLIYKFTSDSIPFCIEYYDNSFYVGTAYARGAGNKDNNTRGSLYKIDIINDKDSLTINTANKIIEISYNGKAYSTEYNLSAEKSEFKTTLNFDNTMTKEQWEQEYSKIKNLNLIFATIGIGENINLDTSTSYFNSVLSKNITDFSRKYATAVQYAQSMFANGLNIQDNLFTLTATKISEDQDQYKTQITLIINSDSDFNSLKPNTDNNNNNINNSITNNITNNNNSNNNSELNDYIENNDKLPQTGRTFELKNLLQIIIIVAIIIISVLVIKENKSKKTKKE